MNIVRSPAVILFHYGEQKCVFLLDRPICFAGALSMVKQVSVAGGKRGLDLKNRA